MSEFYDNLETRSADERSQAQLTAIREQIEHVQNHTAAYAESLKDFDRQFKQHAGGFDDARRGAFRRLQCIRVAARRHQRKQGEGRAKPLFDERSDHLPMLSRVSRERCGGSHWPSGAGSTTSILPLPIPKSEWKPDELNGNR